MNKKKIQRCCLKPNGYIDLLTLNRSKVDLHKVQIANSLVRCTHFKVKMKEKWREKNEHGL